MHKPALILHGHFYQPPRENPWTEEVEREPSAAPFHDWNQRIHAECYRPNGWARITDDRQAVAGVVNNYALTSFNFGATLNRWLERHHPATLQRIIDADRISVDQHGGHGNAIAQGYNHAILPLCNDRDLRTQVRWGLAEFRFRFQREPESLWMPETACDDRTLGVLIDEGQRYALLAPGQAARVKIDGKWRDVSDGSIDPRRPYRYFHRDGSGRSIALFFYDGGLSRAVAFEGALASSGALLDRFERASAGSGSVVHVATDGETYGHHFKFGDRCLAYALSREAASRGFWVTNYGELLDHHPPTIEVELKAGDDGKGTAWSCAHGVGRWMRDCGCHTGGQSGWTQRWRAPLRKALDVLRDESAAFFEEAAGQLCDDPWSLRDAYVDLLLTPRQDRRQFFERVTGRHLDEKARLRATRLCASQRSAMLMYTSCGWFFSELSGIETIQIIRYAAHLCDQLEALGHRGHEKRFLEALAEAKSNLAMFGSGADIYRQHAQPLRVSPDNLAAHVALMSLPATRAEVSAGEVGGHTFAVSELRRERRGRIAVATGRVELTDRATEQQHVFAMCALHFGGVDMHCVLRPWDACPSLPEATARICEALESGSLMSLVRVAEEELGPEDYGLSNLLEGARAEISALLFADVRDRYAAQYEAMYQDARHTIAQFHDAGLDVPEQLRTAAGLALAHRFDEEIDAAPREQFNAAAYGVARAIAAEAKRYGCTLRHHAARAHLSAQLTRALGRIRDGGDCDEAVAIVETAAALGTELERDRAQELLIEAVESGTTTSDALRALSRTLGVSDEVFA